MSESSQVAALWLWALFIDCRVELAVGRVCVRCVCAQLTTVTTVSAVYQPGKLLTLPGIKQSPKQIKQRPAVAAGAAAGPAGLSQPLWLPRQQRSRRWFQRGSFVGVHMGPWLKQAKLTEGVRRPSPSLPVALGNWWDRSGFYGRIWVWSGWKDTLMLTPTCINPCKLMSDPAGRPTRRTCETTCLTMAAADQYRCGLATYRGGRSFSPHSSVLVFTSQHLRSSKWGERSCDSVNVWERPSSVRCWFDALCWHNLNIYLYQHFNGFFKTREVQESFWWIYHRYRTNPRCSQFTVYLFIYNINK